MPIEYSFRVGEHEVWPRLDLVKGPTGPRHLEPRVMACLELLARRAGQVISKAEFFDAVWGESHVGDDALVRCISVLRRALGDEVSTQHSIQTIPKKGYRLVAAVTGLSDGNRSSIANRWKLTLEAVLASCSDHVYVYDREHRYLLASEAGARAIGIETAAMIGRSWQELGMPAEIMQPFEAELASVLADGSPIRRSTSYPTIYGTRHYEYILDPIYEEKEIVAVVAFVRQLV